MKYIKRFETLFTNYKDNGYLLGNRGEYEHESLIVRDLLEIIGVGVDHEDKNPNEDWVCKYNIDVIKFLKEIFLGKEITFYSKNKNDDKWYTKVIIEDVNLFAYKDDVYISVKFDDKDNNNDDNYDSWNWKLIDNSTLTNIYDYDASDKPEHKKLKLLKKSIKYNII